ncbi:Uncharacterised protein [Bordetella pertussis]|nr:Uncharacterised protein [Bordetella pertussis]
MPTVEPSCGGLSISGRPRRSGTRRSSVLPPSTSKAGVGKPCCSHTRLVMILSIDRLEASGPLPV